MSHKASATEPPTRPSEKGREKKLGRKSARREGRKERAREPVSREPHAAQWSFNLLINSAYFQSRCRLREGRGGGSLQQQQEGGGSAREERGLRGESLGMRCQMSRSLAHSSEEPLQGEQRRTCSQEGGRREEKLCRHGCCQSGSTWSPSPGCLSLAQAPGQVRGPSVVSLPS